MTRILAFFLVALSVAFGLDAFIDASMNRIRTSDVGAFNKWITGQANAEIVISGSSRAVSHYDPRIIESITGMSAYNIGRNASHIDLQLAMLRVYLERNTKPKLIIHNLDLFSFETTPKGDIYEPATYVPYLSNEALYTALREINPDVLKWRYLPLYAYAVEDLKLLWAKGVASWVRSERSDDFFAGFNPRNSEWNQDFESFRAQNPNGVTFALEPSGIQALASLIDLCRVHGIPLLLVYSPEYADMQVLERNRNDIMQRFSDMADSAGVQFLDYSEHILCKDTAFFQNSQHLNARGAEQFTRHLALKLVESKFVSTAH